jgi:hypothetical protein
MRPPTVVSLLLAVLIVGCDPSTTGPTAVNLGERFQLGYGQSATVSHTGVTVTFKSLGEDSRCPEGCCCIWAGNARVIISVAGMDTSLNSYLEPKEISCSEYRITLLDVRPYPRLDEHIDSQSYTIILIITRE